MYVKKITISAIQDGAGGIFKLSKPDVYNNPGIKTACKVLKNAIADTDLYCLDSVLPKQKKNSPKSLLDILGIKFQPHKLSEHITAYHPKVEQLEANRMVKGDHNVNGIYF